MNLWTNKLIILTCSLFIFGSTIVHAEPREELIEQALLQQLHPAVQASLQSIYHEKYSQYSCEHIVSINERVTASKKKAKAKPVDAIHGQKYFIITVGLLRTNGEYVELYLKNDTAEARYYLLSYKKGALPDDFKCSPFE